MSVRHGSDVVAALAARVRETCAELRGRASGLSAGEAGRCDCPFHESCTEARARAAGRPLVVPARETQED